MILDTFVNDEATILLNKKEGKIYVADFTKNNGKYISVTLNGENQPDLNIQVSQKICLRVTYIEKSSKITGVEISKVTSGSDHVDKLNFTTLDFHKILQLLSLFTELDLKSVVNKSIILDQSIVGDPQELERFLNVIAVDPKGKEKLKEVVQNFELLESGDIDNLVERKKAIELFEELLDDSNKFNSFKDQHNIGKDEEVWQQFFSTNSWLLGSEFVKILDQRRLNEDNICDYLVESYDGYLDAVELKLHTTDFWTNGENPKSELTAATMQCLKYLSQIERKMNDNDFIKRIDGLPIAKPRITLIFGRSNSWNENQKELYRVLNSSYSSLNIMTFDHILERAKKQIEQKKTLT